MQPTKRFSNRADDYRLYRPSYPAQVIDLIRHVAGLRNGASVADIGAGTGIFSKLLLEAGFAVSAVEPNERMRDACRQELRHFAGFQSVAAAAENTGLPAGTFSAITVAQAFHWFDHVAARLEFRRLLTPGGWVFIIRNQRQVDTSPFARDYESLLATLGESYQAVTHRDSSSGVRARQHFFPAGAVQFAEFDNPHVMDWPGLRGRFLSSSYVPAQGDQRHDDYVHRLAQLFQKYARDDRVMFDQNTEVVYGKLD